MGQWVRFSEFDATNERRVAKVKDFLDKNELALSDDVELFVTASEEGEMVACGGISGKILKCVAVTPRLRGQRFVLKVIDELLAAAKKRGQEELFLFSAPKNKEYFESHGFKLIESSGNEVLLMENSDNLTHYKASLRQKRVEGNVIGSAVLCDSPLQEKEMALIRQASKQCDWLHIFIVCEDGSHSSERTEVLTQNLAGFSNITVHENSEYLISKATFPTYFIKDQDHISALHAELDVKIFKRHIAPTLGITHRFIGCESDVNEAYNTLMKRILPQSWEDAPSVEVVQLG
ncbi:MAG: [citrate (pro-3S)-lyase] ligase [Campylobacterales bacterium]|nr:[citrate (pro-3S)-lyase] ligase [Campylobacterales bacterium]